jgi:hypothetical protein
VVLPAGVCITRTWSFAVSIPYGADTPYSKSWDACAALDTFKRRVGLPTPLLVKTGNSLDAIWPLTRPVPWEEWCSTAGGLVMNCLSRGLHVDHARTLDANAVWLAPGSLNTAPFSSRSSTTATARSRSRRSTG